MTLAESNAAIRSRADFVAFVKILTKDLRENPEEWQNVSLDRFLEALGAWAEDMEGFYLNQGRSVPAQPDWKVVADLLLAAKMYE